MVFADHLQLVVETVGDDHVADIIHHQRVGAAEFEVTFAAASKATRELLIFFLDDIDAIQTNI